MTKEAFNTIITTNFDDLIQDALIYRGLKRALVITHQDLSKFIERNSTPLIVKIHGDAHLHPFNSTSTTKEIPIELKESIKQLSNNIKMVFIGYSGNDESIANLLEYCDRVNYVYWLNDKAPTVDVELSNWWKNTPNKVFVKEFDFDKIMLGIKDKFDLKEPNFQYRANELKDAYDKFKLAQNKILAEDENKTDYDYLLLGINYNVEGKYGEAIKLYKKAIDINPKCDSAYYNMGNSYVKIEKYEEAIESYKKAIDVNPKNYTRYINLFELRLTQTQAFDRELEDKFIELFSNQKEILIEYKMLKILDFL